MKKSERNKTIIMGIKNFRQTMILLLLVFSQIVNTQVSNKDSINPLIPDNSTDVEINANEFFNLINAKQIVFQLRKKYGIKGSVTLTQALWQILTSYSNQQQAQIIWQRAINDLNDPQKNKLNPIVDLQFSMGQILSANTHGMNLQKWDDTRLGLSIKKSNIGDFLTLNDDLTVYLHLTQVWESILIDIIKQENILWNEVFLDSIDFFSDVDGSFQPEEVTGDTFDFFIKFINWKNSSNPEINLAGLVANIESHNQINNKFFQAIVRFSLNKQNNHYLASALSWFEVVHRIYQEKEVFGGNVAFFDYIEEIDAWFLSKEQQLLAVDEKLPELVETSIHELKLFFQHENNPDVVDVQITPSQLPLIYQLVEPNFNKYMTSPLRTMVREQLEVCLNISEEYLPNPQLPIDINQFKGCVSDMVNAATIEAKERSISGSLIKIDTNEALDRALQLPAWQVINILFARIADNECINDSHQLTNPLEWTLSVESLLWFADRWPGYVSNYMDHDQIKMAITEGEKLDNGVVCINKSKQEVVNDIYNQIGQSWQNVKTQLKDVASEFNQQNLSVGSDINFLQGLDNHSNYRVEDATIPACNDQKSCGVHVQLEPSRALFSLFPKHLLLADQLKMGDLKLCYDNVGWENRRTTSSHLDNPSVSDYFGNFSFSIKGFYNKELVFERKLISDEESHYLFAENTDDVLSIYCPLSIVGSKISTTLKEGTYGLVPNRLTFLTASRANESKILANNWSAGKEWRDHLFNDNSLIVSENNLNDLNPDIYQLYQNKATELNDMIYQVLLNTTNDQTDLQKQLSLGFVNMVRMTQLFSHTTFILQNDDYLFNDQLHGIIFGSNKFPDVSTIKEFYDNQLNIIQLIKTVDEIIENNQIKWNKLQKSWSNAYLKTLLYRLKSI